MRKLNDNEINLGLEKLGKWDLIDGKLTKETECKDFKNALDLVNKVGDAAENLKHHPDIFLHSWNKVKITIYTHKVGGLTEKDFELAEKIDGLH